MFQEQTISFARRFGHGIWPFSRELQHLLEYKLIIGQYDIQFTLTLTCCPSFKMLLLAMRSQT